MLSILRFHQNYIFVPNRKNNVQGPKSLLQTEEKYAIIGAGPSGISAAKALKEQGIPFDGFELGVDVGGLWNINNPNSIVYESAHLISSKKQTEFKDFPMPEHWPDYPSHREMYSYFQAYAEEFDLYPHYSFQTKVIKTERKGEQWEITVEQNGQRSSHLYKGLIIANGMLAQPNYPKFKGEFTGEIWHSSQYKNAAIFEGKRVLIIGAGNSGCDIAVDAAHRSPKVDVSVRRGYYFVPKYIMGKPSDTLGGKWRLPRPLQQWIGGKLLKWVVGDLQHFGFPAPDHKVYESRPVMNTLILQHIGQGDINIRGDIKQFEGQTVHFKDGQKEEYDILMLATGYKLDYPFIDKKELNWQERAPKLYLNMFHPQYDNLFVLGMVEAVGLGWEGRAEQARLVANFIAGLEQGCAEALDFKTKKAGPNPDMTAGYKYLKQDNMPFCVDTSTYRSILEKEAAALPQ